jgi:hypothetical protein
MDHPTPYVAAWPMSPKNPPTPAAATKAWRMPWRVEVEWQTRAAPASASGIPIRAAIVGRSPPSNPATTGTPAPKCRDRGGRADVTELHGAEEGQRPDRARHPCQAAEHDGAAVDRVADQGKRHRQEGEAEGPPTQDHRPGADAPAGQAPEKVGPTETAPSRQAQYDCDHSSPPRSPDHAGQMTSRSSGVAPTHVQCDAKEPPARGNR